MPKKTDFLYSAIGRLLMYLGYSLGLWKQVLEDKGIREITFPLYYFFLHCSKCIFFPGNEVRLLPEEKIG